MQVIKEISLQSFDFWSGAKDNADKLTYSEFIFLEEILEDIFCEKTPTETEINDLFWFDFEFLCESIGLEEKEVLNR
jgi:hypothetical protein